MTEGKELRTVAKIFYQSSVFFVRWLMLAAVVGSIVGVMGVLFHFSVEKATELRTEFPWLLYLLPLGGVLIALLYQKSGMAKDMGTNTIIEAVRGEHPLRMRTAPLIFISTVITHLLGGSSGREGAALQIGGSMGARLADWMDLDQKEHQMMIMCGMSTCFAALFGTPLTATIFAIEVVSVGVMHYAALVPCVLGALIGYGIAQIFEVAPTAFVIQNVPQLGLASTVQVIVLSILCAVLSAIFCISMHAAGKLYKKYQDKEMNLPMEELPSTSPANAAYSLEKLTEIWSRAITEV